MTLAQVARLDSTDVEHPILEGTLDIPMGFHTPRLAFVGRDGRSPVDGSISLRRIRVVQMATGRLVDDIETPDDQGGMVMTDIYANVERGTAPSQLTLHIGGGKMGEDEQVRYRSR